MSGTAQNWSAIIWRTR